MRTVKYYLGDILKDGLPCSNAIVRWETLSPCIVLTCHLPDKVVDGKKLTNGVEFSIDDDMENCSPCVKYHIECPGCTNCPIVDKTLCFCTGPTDCPPCHVCINGECIPTCDICDPVTGDCVSCNDEHPCPGDQICVQGECQCPQGKYDPVTGKCVECIVGDVNPNNPCLICLGGSWAQKICASGVVDPVTCDCTGCNGNTDCGENQCCYDGECLCCKDSAVYDPILGKCVPKPPCDPNTPCPECMDCLNGQCVPRVCPEGYICVGDSCVPECDCNNPTCNTANACVPTADGRCYCSPCSGACSSGAECGPGCYCDNGQCKPKPCVGTCVNGGDCGPGCGCLNGECVPCNSVNCATNPSLCSQILGCKCNGNTCSKSEGCNDKPCVTSANCQQGCTCDKGICKDCSNYSCDDCANHPGCKCISGTCGDDPDNDCKDTLTLKKVDESCDLKAELILKEPCSCSALSIFSRVHGIIYSDAPNEVRIITKLELRKGTGPNSPKLGDTTSDLIADNDLPLSGNIKVTQIRKHKKVNTTTGAFISNGETKWSTSVNVAGEDSFTLENSDFGIGYTHIAIGSILVGSSNSQTTDIVTSYEYYIEQTSDFTFANTCVYKAPKAVNPYIFTTNAQLTSGNLNIVDKITPIITDAKRNPRLTWYKTKDAAFDSTDKFRSLYLPLQGGKYTDTLFGLGQIDPKGKYPLVGQEGELWSGYNWLVKTDCGCVEDAGLDDVYFCNPKTIGSELNGCHTGIKLKGPFVPCDVNQDIRPHQKAGYTIPDAVQTVYQLWINGKLFKSFVHNAQVGGMVVYDTSASGNDRYTTEPMFSNNFFYTLNDEEIKTAEIRMNHGNKCNIKIPINPLTPRTIVDTIDCSLIGNEYTVKVNANQGGFTIQNVTGANSFTLVGGVFTLYLTKGLSTEITFIFSDGCKAKKTYKECNCDINPEASITAGDFCTGQTGQITITGTQGATVTYIEDGVNKTKVLGSPFVINTTSTKVVKLVSVALNGCISTINTTVTATLITLPTATITASDNAICSGEAVTLTFGGSNGATANLYQNGVVLQEVTIPSTLVVNPTVSTSYYLGGISLGTCINNTNTSPVNITVTPGPGELTWTESCNGTSTTRTFTFNQNVVYNGGSPTSTLAVASGIGSIVVTYGSGSCVITKTIPVDSCGCDVLVTISASPAAICNGGSTTLSAVVTGGVAPYQYQWYRAGITAGTGTTLNTTPANTTEYYLKITDAEGCVVNSNTLVVTVNSPTPFGIISANSNGVTESGESLLVCNNITQLTLISSFPFPSGKLTWNLVNPGNYSGGLTFPTITPAITLTMADVTSGLIVTATGINEFGCAYTTQKQIIKQACACTTQPTANAGIDQTSSGVTPINLNGIVSFDTNGLLWTTSGSGTFGNPLLAVTTYTPSVSDIAAGTVTLTLTVNDPDGAGPCTSAVDTVVITLTPGTCCNGVNPNNSIDLDDPDVSFAAKEYAMLTDLTIGNIDTADSKCGLPAAYIWSNNTINPGDPSNLAPDAIPGTVANGTQEYFIKNTSGCASQVIADAEFNGPNNSRTILASLADVVASANVRLASMPSPYNTMYLTVAGNVLKLNNAPYCFRLSGVARFGNVDTCDTITHKDSVITGKGSTNFGLLNT